MQQNQKGENMKSKLLTAVFLICTSAIYGNENIIHRVNNAEWKAWGNNASIQISRKKEQGKEIVVFEDLYKDDILVASHADIEDENQTIKFKNWEILVNKVDSITGNNIISKEFEFTMYSDEDLQEEVITKAGNTEDGTALFEITEGTWYIKETRAPEGYKLSDEVVKVEVKDNTMYVNDKEVNTDDDYLYSIVYQNVMLPSTQIKTGTHTNTWLFVGIACISGLAIVALVLKRKRS